MRFDKLDLNLLVAFDALIERRSVSVAANDLCLSQSAMSGALNRLREYFEDDLLVQSGRSMLPTPRAIELAKPVREALLFVRGNITTPQQFDAATSERCFSVVGSDYAQQILLAEAIGEIANEAPSITFKITNPDKACVDRFNRGEIDIFITIESSSLGLFDTHPRSLLFEDEEVAICWDGNETCRHGVTLEAFNNLGHVTVNFGPDRVPAVSEMIFEDKGIARKIEVTVPTFSCLPGALLGTQRIATMHRRHANFFARHMPIKVFPLPFEMPKVREMMVWHASHNNDAGLKWLRGKFQSIADRLD
ncbi:nodulation protein D 1 [Novosphingobium endophyticum]|uniref:Nodulation protein D 1 n=1 Tax=Novosphingobium endophyticum TaxID=1955250 RepID=A0A916X4Q2_9SPHN|nr:LysR family transcriptional regulator [Novosphingobium endophyticum]GGB94631.1 nodulation protein D 1 [Novosphingobium endophyticum]